MSFNGKVAIVTGAGQGMAWLFVRAWLVQVQK
jgi:NAD(P)-dependent dehydrogenase (short-subunit alcohol dehydrogenase family)